MTLNPYQNPTFSSSQTPTTQHFTRCLLPPVPRRSNACRKSSAWPTAIQPFDRDVQLRDQLTNWPGISSHQLTAPIGIEVREVDPMIIVANENAPTRKRLTRATSSLARTSAASVKRVCQVGETDLPEGERTRMTKFAALL
jgi:hypothetical protein